MSGFNRTGSQGQGSQTGRGLGKCNPKTQKDDESAETDELSKGLGMRKGKRMRKGSGKGRGLGRGLGKNNL